MLTAQKIAADLSAVGRALTPHMMRVVSRHTSMLDAIATKAAAYRDAVRGWRPGDAAKEKSQRRKPRGRDKLLVELFWLLDIKDLADLADKGTDR